MTIDRVRIEPPAEPAGDPASDADLLRRMIGGSEDALATLYDRHGRAVFAAAIRATSDPGVAAEVVQETFLALWNRGELFDPSRGALATWLVTIARNRSIDRLRSAARHERAITFASFGRVETDDVSVAEWLTTSGDLIGAAGPEPDPEDALASAETRASIERAIASLAPVERSVIELAYVGGLSQSEIAARLGWPIGTVKTRTRRALAHLREWMEKPPGRPVQAALTPASRASAVACPAPCH
jgi:RNA polymerase sigma-70 factor, ECF subfamily